MRTYGYEWFWMVMNGFVRGTGIWNPSILWGKYSPGLNLGVYRKVHPVTPDQAHLRSILEFGRACAQSSSDLFIKINVDLHNWVLCNIAKIISLYSFPFSLHFISFTWWKQYGWPVFDICPYPKIKTRLTTAITSICQSHFARSSSVQFNVVNGNANAKRYQDVRKVHFTAFHYT